MSGAALCSQHARAVATLPKHDGRATKRLHDGVDHVPLNGPM